MDIKKLSSFFKRAEDSTNIDNLNFLDAHVEKSTSSVDLISAKSVYLFSTPPLLEQAERPGNRNRIKTIGLARDFQLVDQKLSAPVSEFGASEIKKLPGRVILSAQMSRVLINHNNLTYCLYRWFIEHLPEDRFGVSIDTKLERLNDLIRNKAKGKFPISSNAAFFANVGDNQEKKYINKHIVSLSAPITLMKFGLMVLPYDGEGGLASGQFLENCSLIYSGYSVIADNPFLLGNVSIEVTRSLPISTGLSLNYYPIQKKPYIFPQPNISDTIDGSYNNFNGGAGAGTSQGISAQATASQAFFNGAGAGTSQNLF